MCVALSLSPCKRASSYCGMRLQMMHAFDASCMPVYLPKKPRVNGVKNDKLSSSDDDDDDDGIVAH